jgi:Na+-transporting NADH:ubiquinone oxidoreductase subunit NqrF
VQVTLIGMASGKIFLLEYSIHDLEKTLLNFLVEKEVTIASSCSGHGICKKCTIQKDWLTCEMTLKQFLERQADRKIYISYL